MRGAGASSVELPGVRLTLYQSRPAAMQEPDQAWEPSPEASKAGASDPYLASGIVPIDLVAQRKAASE